MEIIVQILLVLAAFNAIIQISQWSLWPRIFITLFLVGFTFISHYQLIEQSKNELSSLFINPIFMQDVAVIQLLEFFLFVYVSQGIIRSYLDDTIKHHIRYLNFIPGIIFIAGILYLEMILFYSFSSIDYKVLSLLFAILVGIFFMVFPLIIRRLIPENFLRMELRYIINCGQLICCVAITVFCQRLPYSAKKTSFDVYPLLGTLIITTILFLAGWIWFKIKNKITLKWKL